MSNKGAFLMAKQAKPFEVHESPMPVPGETEIVIKNHVVALNPVDWYIQELGIIIESYPKIIGEDAAGEVTAVGAAVTEFKPGDRVTAMINLNYQSGADGAFQLYVKTNANLAAKIPEDLEYKAACVLPLTISTAASALFEKDTLALPLPQLSPKTTGQVLVVWAGSTSVGSCAIQMAVAAGLDVATTASARNHEYCKSLGATWVFDYTSENVLDDIVAALAGKTTVGVLDAWSRDDAPAKSAELTMKLEGRTFLQTVMPPGMKVEGVPDGVELGYAAAANVAFNEVGVAVWREWMPKALAAGTLKCKPDPFVVGQGLEMIQAACDQGVKGVSASKLVVELA